MDFTSIHNYYEHLVFNYLKDHELAKSRFIDEEFLQDVACYSLSQLPARYIRHEVDMAFFVEAEQREAMELEVKNTVDDAIIYIDKNFNKDDRYATAEIVTDDEVVDEGSEA